MVLVVSIDTEFLGLWRETEMCMAEQNCPADRTQVRERKRGNTHIDLLLARHYLPAMPVNS